MTFLTVDAEKCIKDRHCVHECPVRIIELREGDDELPRLTDLMPNAEELCIECGHCVAICPKGALTHRDLSPDQLPPVLDELALGPAQVEHFLRARRSTRSYKKKPVERDTLVRLIEAARFAPTGHNLQPVQWHVIHDSDEVHRLTGLVADWMRFMMEKHPDIANDLHMDIVVEAWDQGADRICRGAPHIITAHAGANDRTAPQACTIAMATLELAAPSFGLATCWAGYFNSAAALWPPMLKALGLPEGHAPYASIMVGHGRHRYRRLPPRNEPTITWK